jgi:hypothetical protein
MGHYDRKGCGQRDCICRRETRPTTYKPKVWLINPNTLKVEEGACRTQKEKLVNGDKVFKDIETILILQEVGRDIFLTQKEAAENLRTFLNSEMYRLSEALGSLDTFGRD